MANRWDGDINAWYGEHMTTVVTRTATSRRRARPTRARCHRRPVRLSGRRVLAIISLECAICCSDHLLRGRGSLPVDGRRRIRGAVPRRRPLRTLAPDERRYPPCITWCIDTLCTLHTATQHLRIIAMMVHNPPAMLSRCSPSQVEAWRPCREARP